MKRSQLPPTGQQQQQRPGTPLHHQQQQHSLRSPPSSGKRRKGSPTRERILTGTHNSTYMDQPTTSTATSIGVSMLGSVSRPPSSTDEPRLGDVIHKPISRGNVTSSKSANTTKSGSSPAKHQLSQSPDGVSSSFSGAFGAARRTAESKFKGHRRDWKYRPAAKK